VNRLWTALVVLAAIAVTLAAGYVITHQTPVPEAGQALGYSPAPIETNSTVLSPTPSHSRAAPTTRVSVAFLGDDYTTGAGATAPPARFSTLLSTALHLTELNFGGAGSGYSVAGTTGNYLARLDEVVAAKPDVVVVSGGRNDVDSNAAAVATNVRTLFSGLHRRLPTAVLVAVAPFWGDSPPRTALAPIAAAVRTAVTAAGGSYLAIGDPLLGHPEWMANLADPNNAGHIAIEAALEAPLRDLVSTARAPGGEASSSSTSSH